MPSIATSTTPTGWKCEKLVTMTDRNSVNDEPVSRFWIVSASPERGSITSNVT
jgi:hypothetical protein